VENDWKKNNQGVTIPLITETNTIDFSAFGGYFNTLTPKQMKPVWEFTKTIHKGN
jgi:hypothetical protein